MITKIRVNFGNKNPCCHHPKTGEQCIYFDGKVDCTDLKEQGKRDDCSDLTGNKYCIFVNRNIFIYLIRKVIGV